MLLGWRGLEQIALNEGLYRQMLKMSYATKPAFRLTLLLRTRGTRSSLCWVLSLMQSISVTWSPTSLQILYVSFAKALNEQGHIISKVVL